MINYKTKYLKYKMKYCNLKKGGMNLFNVFGSSTVDDDDDVDPSEAAAMGLDYGHFQGRIQQSLQQVPQTTDIRDSDHFPHGLDETNYYVLVMHGLIGDENTILNKTTAKTYDFNHKVLTSNEKDNKKIIKSYLKTNPDSIFVQYATTDGNTCQFSDKPHTMQFLKGIKAAYYETMNETNDIMDFFKKTPRYSGFILQALYEYHPDNNQQNVLLHREDDDPNFDREHNIYHMSNGSGKNPKTLLGSSVAKQFKYHVFYLNQIIAFIIKNTKPNGPIVITLAVCRGETVADPTFPSAKARKAKEHKKPSRATRTGDVGWTDYDDSHVDYTQKELGRLESDARTNNSTHHLGRTDSIQGEAEGEPIMEYQQSEPNSPQTESLPESCNPQKERCGGCIIA